MPPRARQGLVRIKEQRPPPPVRRGNAKWESPKAQLVPAPVGDSHLFFMGHLPLGADAIEEEAQGGRHQVRGREVDSAIVA